MSSQETCCRLCFTIILDERINMLDLSAKVGNILAIIVQHFGIEVKLDDKQSTSICKPCWTITDDFHRLYERVQQAETNLLKSDITGDDCIQYSLDVKHEMYPDNSDPPNDADIACATSLKDESQDESVMSSSSNSSCSSKNKILASSNYITTNKVVGDQKQRDKVDQEDQQIREFFSMNCEMCDLVFRTVNEASMHYKRSHNKAGYLTCCGKKFFRRCMAIEHIQHHLNPSLLRCEQCCKSFSTPYVLRNHMLSHAVGSVHTDLVCSICMRSFSSKMQLSQHMRRMHFFSEERKFGCDICGKFYLNKRVLTMHIRGVHENAFAQMCHVCARTFKSKHVYTQHMRDHFEADSPKLQCSICGSWLKNDRGLRLHMRRHTETQVRCTLCDKQTSNRHALGMHMRYVHSDAKHKCTICEKAFKKPIGLREHMASHTGVDLYACPYCAKTFKSNANMHSHRKKDHFEQWTQDRHQRYTPQLAITQPA